MPPSAVLFIDGSNFYHALKKEGRYPFDYDAFFSELSKRFELKTIYFYDAYKDIEKDPIGYAGQQRFHSKLEKMKWPIKIKTRKLKYLANITPEQVDNAANEVGIIDACKNKLWALLQYLRLVRLTKEKGIDVLLVVDSIETARTKQYDAILLLSGDADFVPAVHLIKSFGVKVWNVHAYSGSAKELRDSCDGHILIDFDSDRIILR